MKKQQIILLALLAMAAAFTVGCGSSSVPTFSKLPFASNRVVTPATSLFFMNLDGSSVTPVVYSGSFYTPSISADFKTIAFVSGGEVWVSNATGSSQTKLTTNSASSQASYYSKISPSGKKILFGIYNGSTYHLWIMNPDGTSQTDLTPTLPTGMNGCYAGNFSADSSKIVFACYGSGSYGVYTMHSDGSHTSTVITQTNFMDTPMFSPDGKKILFVDFAPVPGAVQTAAHMPSFGRGRSAANRSVAQVASNQGIVSVNLDGTGLTDLVPGTFEAEILNSTLYYTLYSSTLGFDQIYKANLDGTGAVSVSDGTADDWLALSQD